MFDLFRSRDKAVRIMLGGLLLLVAFSMLTYLVPNYNTGGSATDTVVAEIGKDTITVPEVQEMIRQRTRNRQFPAQLIPHYVPQFINSMVTERAMAFEAERLGFKVSDEELAAGIRQTIPQLFQDGKFAGKEAYEQVLAQQNMTIPQFEAEMSREMMIGKMRAIALEGAVVTPQEIQQEYHHRNDKVKIQYVKIAGDKLRAGIQPTSEELHKYYDANKPLYQVPEKRNLGVLLLDQAKIEATVEPTDADLMHEYNDNKDAYRTPERVNVRHILLKTTGTDPKADAAVKTKADDLVKQLRAGANFADMAKKYSEDPGSKEKGGEYDGVVRGQMVPEFEKAAFSLKINQIGDPVKTAYGYHIIQTLSHEQAQLKPFNDVKAALAEQFKKQRANELMQKRSDDAQTALTKDPQHPEKVATDLGIQYLKADNIGPGDDIPEIGKNKEFADSISGLKKGEVSQQVTLGPNKVAMAVCLDDIAAHPASFDDVQAKVRDGFIKEKETHLLEEKATALMDKARANGNDLAAAAKSLGLEVKDSEPVDRAGSIEGLGAAGMFPDAFSKPAGSLFGPSVLGDAKIVGKILEKVPADPAGLAAQTASIREQIKNQRAQSRATLFEEGVRDALTKEGKVKVHKDVVDRIVSSYRG